MKGIAWIKGREGVEKGEGRVGGEREGREGKEGGCEDVIINPSNTKIQYYYYVNRCVFPKIIFTYL